MNILLVNKYHFYNGGSDFAYLETGNILKERGNKVIYFSVQNPDNLPCETENYFLPYLDLRNTRGAINKFKAIGRILYSFEAKKLISKLLDKYQVDVAHLHNIHHHISPSILHELKRRKIPVVMTLHDLKMVCASYYFLVKGKTCEACKGGKYYMTIRHCCVRESLAKSIVCTLEMYLHHAILDIYNKADVVICTSLFQKHKLADMGFKTETVFLPNFVDLREFKEFDSEIENINGQKKNSIVYVGRLSGEKGLWTLIKAANLLLKEKRNIEIIIIGRGILRETLQNEVKLKRITNVRFLGYVSCKELYQEIKKSMAVVLPSECYENNPISIFEAFALNRPVIGARIGGIPELVRDNETGLTFEPGNADDLSSKIRYFVNNPEETVRMGRNARSLVEGELSKEKHYEKLMEIYKYAMSKYNS